MKRDPYQNRKDRWLKAYDMGSAERLLFLIDIKSDPAESGRPWPNPENRNALSDWALRKYDCLVERATWLDDDRIPFIDLYTGTEIFAGAFGCPVHRPADNMPFALPIVSDAGMAGKIRVPRLEDTPLYSLLEDAHALRARAGTDALLRLPDIQSPMDIAALIWDKNDFYAALIEEPAAVIDLSDKVMQLLTAFLDLWFQSFGPGYIAHYPSYYMESGLTISVDEIGVVSPAAFTQFFAGELAALSGRYHGIGIHCCADAIHQWPNLRQVPGLVLINLVQPEAVLAKAYPYFADCCVQMHSWSGAGPGSSWLANWPGQAHVVINPAAGSRGEAIDLCAKLQALRSDNEG